MICAALSVVITKEFVNALNRIPKMTWTAKAPKEAIETAFMREPSKIPQNLPESSESNCTITKNRQRPVEFSWREQLPECFEPTRPVLTGCQSNWAFVALYEFEDSICTYNKHNTYKQLSAQYIISCSLANEKCKEGYPLQTAVFLHDAGTVPETCFPYIAQDGECPFFCNDGSELDVIRARYSNILNVHGHVDELHDAVLQGPVLLEMLIYDDLFAYDGGVYQHVSGEMRGIDAVEVFGYGVEDGIDYWECRAAFSDSFADNGFFKIRRGTNECSIEDFSCVWTTPWTD